MNVRPNEPIHGWGRCPIVEADELVGEDLESITRDVVLTRGLGRSYGDASLPPRGHGPVASSVQADRVLSFDETKGILRAEAGVTLGRLARLFLPRGFFPPVVPGTRDVTIGGMVAADVHGKNHHVAGTLGNHVLALRMRLPDGSVEEIREETRPEVFRATLGGMGLTGHILEVELAMERIPSRSIVEEALPFPDLESLVDGLQRASLDWPFTVAWSDLLAKRGGFGRGVLLCGRWARAGEAPTSPPREMTRVPIPFAMPSWLLSDTSVGTFHALRYEWASRRAGSNVRSAESFFWPLDAIRDWNLLYGRRGMTQYQCVIPREASMRGVRRVAEVARSGGPGPFLAVVKDCGDEGRGLLSFPMPGVSLALDFPVHEGTPALVARLNEVVLAAGGRIYLAKDAFTRAEDFAAMEHRLGAFLEVRRRLDPHRRLESALAARLFPSD